jgi:acetyltransferase-like isoleucine patch superfamily enzyme
MGKILNTILSPIPYCHFIWETRNLPQPITFKIWFMQKVLGFNRKTYWPVHHRSVVNGSKNYLLGVNVFPGYYPRCYIQGIGKVQIDDYTVIEEGVGIIGANHFMLDIRKHIPGYVKIGKYCVLGRESIILPNVELGDHTHVLPGAVVKDSFVGGYCIVGGNPAVCVESLDREKMKKSEYKANVKYRGYIREKKFESYRKANLWV